MNFKKLSFTNKIDWNLHLTCYLIDSTNFFRTMSSTSQKHRNFVSEPMGDKPVTDLAGIGAVLGERLESKGFDKVFIQY